MTAMRARHDPHRPAAPAGPSTGAPTRRAPALPSGSARWSTRHRLEGADRLVRSSWPPCSAAARPAPASSTDAETGARRVRPGRPGASSRPAIPADLTERVLIQAPRGPPGPGRGARGRPTELRDRADRAAAGRAGRRAGALQDGRSAMLPVVLDVDGADRRRRPRPPATRSAGGPGRDRRRSPAAHPDLPSPRSATPRSTTRSASVVGRRLPAGRDAQPADHAGHPAADLRRAVRRRRAAAARAVGRRGGHRPGRAWCRTCCR